MKDKIKSIKLRRQNSTKSLASELQSPKEIEICKVGSVTSLKSLGKDLINSFKRKENDNESFEEDNDSFEEGWLTMKSKKFGRRLRYCFQYRHFILFSFLIHLQIWS